MAGKRHQRKQPASHRLSLPRPVAEAIEQGGELLALVRTPSATLGLHVFFSNRVASMGAPCTQFPQLVLRVLALVEG